MPILREMSPGDWSLRTDAALSWLRRSIDATGGQGSAHSWHPLLGWARAYPETTGYLVETLLAYADRKQDDTLRQLALGCIQWLHTIQLPSGAYAGLLAGNTAPSVFNTSQILFGLVHAEPLPLQRAVDWLMSVLEPDATWRQAAFVPGFVPTYYTRAVWGVLRANDVLRNPMVERRMREALSWYAERFLPNGMVRDGGFRAGERAFTHTLAYAWEGYFESAVRLGDREGVDRVARSLDQFLSLRHRAGGRTAGRYGMDGRGDYSFLCMTGNFQLSILCHRVWEQTAEPGFRAAADSFLAEVWGFQTLGTNKNTFGAFFASAPAWGAYLPFRYPNWAVKFFLDAMLHFEKRQQ